MTEFEAEKKEIIEIARDLYYGEKVIAALKRAKTSVELTHIMHEARTSKK